MFQSWATGLCINVLNPKIVLFFRNFLPNFASTHGTNRTYKMFFLGVVFIIMLISIVASMLIAADKFVGLIKKKTARHLHRRLSVCRDVFSFRALDHYGAGEVGCSAPAKTACDELEGNAADQTSADDRDRQQLATIGGALVAALISEADEHHGDEAAGGHIKQPVAFS